MKVMMYGTRGSVPICNRFSEEFGGNTTCLLVTSGCLPQGTTLVVDGGSGFVPLADAVKGVTKQVLMLLTHYHHDHTQGIPLASLTFMKEVPFRVFGPFQNGWGPKEALEAVMQKPLFPVAFARVASHFFFQSFEYPELKVILIHPEGGVRICDAEEYERFEKRGKPFSFQAKATYPLSECLVIRMHQTDHPQQTISYRFEERPTGKVFCFLTDHENTDGLPQSLQAHLRGADLLIADAQYDPKTYREKTAGFGHATPIYAVDLAVAVGAKRLGLTHHDPGSDDEAVRAIWNLAVEHAATKSGGVVLAERIFACADYQVIDV